MARRQLQRFIAGLLAAVFFCSSLFIAAASKNDNRLSTFIERSMKSGVIPGMALAMIQNGQLSFVGGFGVTGNGKLLTADTPMLIASLSKAMTAAVVLMLVAEGRIDLDSPVRRYLLDFRVKSIDGGKDNGATITVRHLLNQIGGLSDSGFPEMRMTQPETLAERVVSLQNAVPQFPAGKVFNYFNSNYAVAARIVEVVSGRPFEDVMQERLFLPLGMTSTTAVSTFAAAQALDRPPAIGHVEAYGQAWRAKEQGGFIAGFGGVVSTANDMALWLKWQITGQPRLLPPELLTLMQTPPPNSNHAMGWFNQTENGHTKLFHDGMFSTVASDIVIYPNQKTGAVLLYTIGGTLEAMTSFPAMRAGIMDIARGNPPAEAALSLRTIGSLAAAITMLLAIAALFDLGFSRRWLKRTANMPVWRITAGLIIRIIPFIILFALPWLLQLTIGRAFNFSAVFFAMLDVNAGLAIVSCILAASAIFRLAPILQPNFRLARIDHRNKPGKETLRND